MGQFAHDFFFRLQRNCRSIILMKKEHTYNITLLYKQVIIFDNKGTSVDDSVVTELEDANGNESGASFLVRILQYLETPQYLRRSLFPKHNSLRFVVRNHCLQTYHFDCQNYFCCVSIISLTQRITFYSKFIGFVASS